MDFKLVAEYKPTGDQPQAIDKIVESVLESNAEPEVVKTFATGVKLGERLLRKQEVELNMPSSPSH